MKNVLTVVIKYEEGQEQPSFHAGMEVLGGKVVGVMFDDALERLEELEEADEISSSEFVSDFYGLNPGVGEV